MKSDGHSANIQAFWRWQNQKLAPSSPDNHPLLVEPLSSDLDIKIPSSLYWLISRMVMVASLIYQWIWSHSVLPETEGSHSVADWCGNVIENYCFYVSAPESDHMLCGHGHCSLHRPEIFPPTTRYLKADSNEIFSFIYLQAGNEIFPTDKNGKLLMSKSTFLDAWEVGSNLFQECLGLKSCVMPPWGSALVWNPLYITSWLFFSLFSLKWCVWRFLWRSEDGRRLIPSTRQLPGIKWDCQAWHKGPLPNETFPWSHETHLGAKNTSL